MLNRILNITSNRNLYLFRSSKQIIQQQQRFSSSVNLKDEILEQHVQPIKPQLNLQYIRDNHERLQDNSNKRNTKVDLQKVVNLYEQYRVIKKNLDSLRAKRNEIAATIKKLGKGKEGERNRLVELGKQVKEQLVSEELTHDQTWNEMNLEALKIPNETHPDVPIGPETCAKVLKLVGEKPALLESGQFRVLDHLELGEKLGVIKSAAHTTGHKYYYFTREGAMLEMALSFWAFSKMTNKYGFMPVITPDLVHPSLAEACGFQPRSEATQIYWVKGQDLCLAATSEIPLAGMHANSTIDSRELPIKMVGYSHCFRAETGRGVFNKGIYRVHQFSKVEMFVISTPEQSNEILDQLLEIQIEMFSELGLHFRVLDMPSEDLGAPAYRKYDIEVWIPSRNDYGEISSSSNCTDYQSRRLNMKYQINSGGSDNNNNGSHFVHTLNGTSCAIPRMILAILENNQQPDENASKLIDEAASKGAIVVALPEFFNVDSQILLENKKQLSEQNGGESTKMLSEAAKRNKIFLIGGSILEFDPETNQFFNTCFIYNPNGDLIDKYRKIHLYIAPTFQEDKFVHPGDKMCIIDIGFTKIGIGLCHDLRFPLFSQYLANKGCSLIVYGSQFDTPSGKLYWETLLKCRCIDNYIYCAGVNSAYDGSLNYGHSMVCDPCGQIVDTIPEREGIIITEINIEEIEKQQQFCPLIPFLNFENK
eukprot:gene3599-4481_t